MYTRLATVGRKNATTDLECTVKQDLLSSKKGIMVTSQVRRRRLNSIMLFDEDGNAIGNFQWSLMRIFLTGCISCTTPPALKQAVKASEGQTTWVVSMRKGVLMIRIGGEVVYRKKLRGECGTRYSKVERFSFYDMTCENTFRLTDEMEAGDRVNSTCSGACLPAEE